MVMTSGQKLIVLRLIEEEKDVLFGKLSSRVTSEIKDKKWKAIIAKCRTNFGFDPLPPGKTWKHLRDVTWYNWKTTAKEKRDKNARTGGEGGVEACYTDVEAAVLTIQGMNLATVAGLPLREQWDGDEFSNPRSNIASVENVGGNITPSNSSASVAVSRRRTREAFGETTAVAGDIGASQNSLLSNDNGMRPVEASSERARPLVPDSQNFPALASPAASRSLKFNRLTGQRSTSRTSVGFGSDDDEFRADKKRNLKLHNELMEIQVAYLKLKKRTAQDKFCTR